MPVPGAPERARPYRAGIACCAALRVPPGITHAPCSLPRLDVVGPRAAGAMAAAFFSSGLLLAWGGGSLCFFKYSPSSTPQTDVVAYFGFPDYMISRPGENGAWRGAQHTLS